MCWATRGPANVPVPKTVCTLSFLVFRLGSYFIQSEVLVLSYFPLIMINHVFLSWVQKVGQEGPLLLDLDKKGIEC